MLTAADKDRIEAAVAEAEATTSGELLVVLAGEVSKYREIPLAWAAAAALALPPIVLALSVRPLALLAGDLWTLAQEGALERELGVAVGIYAAVQIVVFVVVMALVSIPAVRRGVTPRTLKSHRVAKAAHHQFSAIAARAAGSATGVLIFVALEDRQVRILADAGIHDKVGDPVWNRAVAAVGAAMKAGRDPTGGIVEAVHICAAALTQHYPATGPRAQLFADRPLEV